MSEADKLFKYLVVVAGGVGKRMGTSTPKQFMPLAGRPLMMHTIERFVSASPATEVIVVLGKELFNEWDRLCREHNFTIPHRMAEGGAERFNSVRSGLNLISRSSLVAVHDAVRPFASSATIENCFREAAIYGNAVPVVTPSETVRQVMRTGNSRILRRNMIRLVQTPQVFNSEIVLKAYSRPYRSSYTDDASVVEAAGEKIHLVEGNPENIKITTPADMILAGEILKRVSS
ncbi:MAG: 2-C-methyl-D-erythritol 4-phosphate cytidylyltransferase [Bacteroidales bacterium]|nr:2-C-methyl-D-erythritol 4-phosphate cytidylyltransferase [Bacteroidales bacterium]